MCSGPSDPTRRSLLDELFTDDGQTLGALEQRLPMTFGVMRHLRVLEEDVMEKVFEIYIRTTPERLWQAITDSEMRRRYSFGLSVVSDWTPGSRVGRRARTAAW
ncbi:MAG: helix-turn-helix domain-containing protein [Thermoleophilaceae bacterium]